MASALHQGARLGLLAALAMAGCVDLKDPPRRTQDDSPATCDQACQDGVALRAVRETMKLAYNLTLQGKPVGLQDVTTACPEGGSARIVGSASSNAEQGATQVNLTYTFAGCVYRQVDHDSADQNYLMTLDGEVVEQGLIAVQPSSTTALVLRSDSLTLSGQVFEPSVDYHADQCALAVSQSGDELSGTLCDRPTGFSF